MHDRTALSLVSIRLYMYWIYDIPRSGMIRDALAQIVHAVKMVENGGILATNHNRSTTKYYFPHLWRNLTKPDIFRSYYPTKPNIFRRGANTC